MPDGFVRNSTCDAKHKSTSENVAEIKDTLDKVWNRLNWFSVTLIATLGAVIVDLITRVTASAHP